MDRQHDDDTHDSAAAPPGPPLPDHGRIEQLQQRLGLSRAEIVATLAAELTRAMAGIECALADGDLHHAGLAAHAARSSALMIDAQPLLERLRTLETCARGGDLPAARAAQDGVELAWAALRGVLPAD
jgi:hypothetical protein